MYDVVCGMKLQPYTPYRYRCSNQQSLQSESAMDILKKLYVGGKISKEEFEMRTENLL